MDTRIEIDVGMFRYRSPERWSELDDSTLADAAVAIFAELRAREAVAASARASIDRDRVGETRHAVRGPRRSEPAWLRPRRSHRTEG